VAVLGSELGFMPVITVRGLALCAGASRSWRDGYSSSSWSRTVAEVIHTDDQHRRTTYSSMILQLSRISFTLLSKVASSRFHFWPKT